ncbi:chromate efflux transporter [Dactylosporangium sp. NPDC000555]|uniref:chromate efflux transporter n=1 Tax=Dactylosporangium sp. NPDC000555 TaxID=3154260 RepID=UPI00331AE0E0
MRTVRLPTFLGYFLGLGTWGFGGPIASVGYMQRDLVERRAWLSRQDFLDGVALGQTMPGPLAAQVVMWLGYLRAGTIGALATAAAFIAPSFALVFAVAVVYAHYQGLPVVQALFHGIAPAVMAIIAVAAYKLARLTNHRDPRLWAISAVLAMVTALTGAEIALLFIAAGLVMILLDAPPRWLRHPNHPAAVVAVPGLGPLAGKTLAGKALAVAAGGGTLLALGWFFLKAGAFIFGSGLAIVPFLREGVVHQHHWLTDGQFLDAVAMGLITPGPVVITATFIGYLVAGWQGAIIATVAIFTPIFLGVVVPGRWFIRHRDNPQIQAFVKGATAAAAGAIAGAVVVLSQQTITDWPAAAIAVVTLGLLLTWKIKEPILVGLSAVAGLALHWPW